MNCNQKVVFAGSRRLTPLKVVPDDSSVKLWGMPVVVISKPETPLGLKMGNRKARRAAKVGKKAK